MNRQTSIGLSAYLLVPAAIAANVAAPAALTAAAESQNIGATVIRLDERNGLIVERVVAPGGKLTTPGPGLVVWTEPQGDHVGTLDAASQSVQLRSRAGTALSPSGRYIAGPSTASFAGPRSSAMDQLLGYRIIRGAGLLTPAPGSLQLDGQVVFRRSIPERKTAAEAELEFQLSSEGKRLGTFRFAADATTVDLGQVVDLPVAMRHGLPPGNYELRPSVGAVTTFRIAPADHPLVLRLNQLAERTDGRDSELFALAATHLLLTHRDENDAVFPFAADALNLLERVGAARRGPGLEELRRSAMSALGMSAQQGTPTAGDTGIPLIDAARRDLGAGRWSDAREKLAQASRDGADARSVRLAALYTAVLAAESAPAESETVAGLFEDAVARIAQAPAGDLFRAHNDYANFLASTSLDRLQNQAFQAATGISGPLTAGLSAWAEARREYAAAAAAADNPVDRAAASVNMAELYSLLADIVRAIPGDPTPQRRQIIERAVALARGGAEAASTADAGAATLAAAHALLAELALRAGDEPSLEKHAAAAEKLFLEAGALAGIESVERTLGLFEARRARVDARRRRPALEHLRRSQSLAEILRDELSPDRIGLSRAGFLARRVYVYERLIELLVAEGKPGEALEVAEAAKARALEDMLVAARRPLGEGPARDASTSVVADWPKGVAAVEYFIGADRSWIFVVGVSGRVTAHELVEEGTPLDSARLVERVEAFSQSMTAQARKMLARLDAGQGYDHAWQDDCFWFTSVLLPEPALAEMRKAPVVIVVPHHVLHYFPFVALVTRRDSAPRTPAQMVSPTFLIDEPFDVAYAPSLTAWRTLRDAAAAPLEEVRAVGVSDYLGRAPALKGVRDDLAHLQAAFGPRVKKIYAEDEAIRAAALRAMSSPGLLLFSTHGSNLPDRPLDSSLRLRQDPSGVERLTAADIYAADVAADLVVLSACFSGLADRTPLPGDDLFGVQRAFLHSGGRSVVSGLWDVFDTTGVELMNDFFIRMSRGEAAPRALAAAQRGFLAKYRKSNETSAEPFLHPYFWAVYTSIGDDRTAFPKSEK